jgi:trehalose 6-phosphate phosphatase
MLKRFAAASPPLVQPVSELRRYCEGHLHRKQLQSNRLDRLVPLHPHELHRFAILLDVDGTILDIAPTPQEVHVPDSLCETLLRIGRRLEGALALVSGRPLSDLDHLFAPLRLPAIGGHGAELRLASDGDAVASRAAPLDAGFRKLLKAAAARHSGIIIEDKDYSVALHYRLAPKEGLALVHDVRRTCENWGDPSIRILSGKAVIEVKGRGFDKGTGVRELMNHAPFAGRIPIFIGDDITDEDAFRVVPEFKGLAMSVGRKLPGVSGLFQSAAEVRQWLAWLSGDAAAPPINGFRSSYIT